MTTTTISHHIFVDFENVQAVNLHLLKNKPAQLIIILGAQQKNLPVDLVQQLMLFKEQACLVEVKASGKNALDFVLAYHIGQWAQQKPRNDFYIVSKDKGYDALVNHLKNKKIKIQRYDEFTQIPIFDKPPKQTNSSSKITSFERLITLLKNAPRNRPTKRQTLISYTDAAFAKKLGEDEVTSLINELQKNKLVSFDANSKVVYHF
ncbi:MAG: NYN domain-containing protein [Thiothrix sp.]|nr:MAG: NYN domain-containing protein [Thiothrix sp.]